MTTIRSSDPTCIREMIKQAISESYRQESLVKIDPLFEKKLDYREFRNEFDRATKSDKITLLENKFRDISIETYHGFKFYKEDMEIINLLFTQIIARYIDGIESKLDPRKGVFLWGDYRIGKTFLMRSISYFSKYLQLVLEDRYPNPPLSKREEKSFFVDCNEEVTLFLSSKDGLLRNELLKSRMTFDDLGQEEYSISRMGSHYKFMDYIVSQRNDLYNRSKQLNKQPFITNFVSNLSIPQIEKHYDERFKLRLLEMSDPLEWKNSTRKT